MTREPLVIGATAPPIVRLRDLIRSAAARQDQGVFVVEGFRAVADVARHSESVESVYVDEELASDRRVLRILESTGRSPDSLVLVRSGTLGRVLDSRTPQGVAATVRIPPSDVRRIADVVSPGHSLGLMVVDGVQDPQNLGALIRVAAASGYGGVICDHKSADPFGPKAARSAVGLLLEVPILRVDSLVATIAALRSADGLRWPVIVADTDGTSYRHARLAQPHFLVLGSEGRGPSPEVAAMADMVVTIPTERSVESLNVGIAAGVLAFEARAQREESR